MRLWPRGWGLGARDRVTSTSGVLATGLIKQAWSGPQSREEFLEVQGFAKGNEELSNFKTSFLRHSEWHPGTPPPWK